MDRAANARNLQDGGAQSAAPPAAPIDLDHLRRYTLGDRRLEHEVLWLFIEQAPVTLAALKCAATRKEWTAAAHTLKGSARAVGAWRLAKLAEQAEKSDGPADRPACETVLRGLDEATAEARAHIVALDQGA